MSSYFENLREKSSNAKNANLLLLTTHQMNVVLDICDARMQATADKGDYSFTLSLGPVFWPTFYNAFKERFGSEFAVYRVGGDLVTISWSRIGD